MLDEEKGHNDASDIEPLISKSPEHNDAKSSSQQSL